MKALITAVGGAVAVAGCVAGLLYLGPDTARPGTAAPPTGAGVSAGEAGAFAAAGSGSASAADTARVRTRAYPGDPAAWTALARAEIEQARATLDAGRLDAAEEALRRSLALDGTDNYGAVTGQGLLANARHEFARGRQYGLRATRMAPDRPDGYAVLADAEIQLGDYPAARAAVQRLLDIAPTAAAYSRAAYDLETHGRPEDAAIALQRAVDSAATPAERAFAEARLGDLAWSGGAVDRAEQHYRRALVAVPGHPYGQAGIARVAAARGHGDRARELYGRLTERTPLPQFLLEAVEARGAAGASGRGSEENGKNGGSEGAVLAAQVRLARAEGGPVDPYLALYAADHGDPEVAVDLMRREWKQARSVIVADALGWALHSAGRDTEALAYARRAARTGWQNALFRYHRGAIEQALGMPEGARHLREAAELNPHLARTSHAPTVRG
ncbi:tetratricopeptide domain protein [Streptomyces sp. 150FB]|uniref:tetratricopeptide repeat protein n=1 Tax=Streptomyces sp. 150FB TaxID=1576605 RepID=UPI00058935D0|nr:tetratricopeptide repeat protein [Streptomyces sp. 150FB]KIF76345.1 tetratricopeptide domain protein [Streptomyces sp. 150FB]